jgi:hypothetical protein
VSALPAPVAASTTVAPAIALPFASRAVTVRARPRRRDRAGAT